MWIQAQTNLKQIDLGVFENGPDVVVTFSENNTANVGEEVGEWLIIQYDDLDFAEYENENEETN